MFSFLLGGRSVLTQAFLCRQTKNIKQIRKQHKNKKACMQGVASCFARFGDDVILPRESKTRHQLSGLAQMWRQSWARFGPLPPHTHTHHICLVLLEQQTCTQKNHTSSLLLVQCLLAFLNQGCQSDKGRQIAPEVSNGIAFLVGSLLPQLLRGTMRAADTQRDLLLMQHCPFSCMVGVPRKKYNNNNNKYINTQDK